MREMEAVGNTGRLTAWGTGPMFNAAFQGSTSLRAFGWPQVVCGWAIVGLAQLGFVQLAQAQDSAPPSAGSLAGKPLSAYLVERLPTLLGLDSAQPAIVFEQGEFRLSSGNTIKLDKLNWERPHAGLSLPDSLGFFGDSKALARALLESDTQARGKPAAGSTPVTAQEAELLSECTSALAASYLATKATLDGGPGSTADAVRQVNLMNSGMALQLAAAEPLEMRSYRLPVQAPLPVAVVGPVPMESGREAPTRKLYPWFDDGVAFLAVTSASGVALQDHFEPRRSVSEADAQAALLTVAPASLHDRTDPSEPFLKWASRVCRRFMFIDSRYVDYVSVVARVMKDEGAAPNKTATVDVDIVNIGSRPLKGTLLMAAIGVSEDATDQRFDLQYAKVVAIDLRPKQKQRFAEKINYKVPSGRGIKLLFGPEIGNGPTEVVATGPAEPIGTCAEVVAGQKTAPPLSAALAAYAMDASSGFANSFDVTNKDDRIGFRTGKFPVIGAKEVVVLPGPELASMTATMVDGVTEATAISAFWTAVRAIRGSCGTKAGEIAKGAKDDAQRMSMDIRMFSPTASLSVHVEDKNKSRQKNEAGNNFRTSIMIFRHSRIFP